MSEEIDQNNGLQGGEEEELTSSRVIPLSGLYERWFLDYASYVILDRAVPYINDGLKPVQRRILHSLKELDDGRYNKAANVIGNTMKYHPHGDASIGDAMVQIGQKNLLIDTQGNWGDPITGDSAAAPRYIEARLSKFALDVVFNPDTTVWQLSYDGRNREPVTLPVKFPLLLAQGAEGIAVGLATKIMPHNFNELIDASIKCLQGERPNLMPDFPTGGLADCSAYNEGMRGGRVKIRAKIEERDRKTLAITEIPYGTTTGSIIENVIAANDKGKIKIKKIEDNTAKDVEIIIHLAPGVSPDVTIDALYAFTDCETSVSPNTCVIKNDKPYFMSVNDVLIENTEITKGLLKQELEIRLNELMEKIFFSSLLKIFIQEGMYKHPDYENAGEFEAVVAVLDNLFEPFFPQFYRTILPEDYKKLIDKPMSSITRFDVKKADEQMKGYENEIKQVKYHLKHLTDYAIAWFEKLKEKYGAGRERTTELRTFDKVTAAEVALANIKFYANRADGFIGTGLRKDEYIGDCSDLDEIIVFREDGQFVVTKIQDKIFVGKGIIHVAVFRKGDDRTVYNLIYRDGKTGVSYVKRFSVLGVTRDKEYDLTGGAKGSKVLYFTANPNGEAEVINIQLRPHSKLRKLQFDLDFAEVVIKGRGAKGNIVTKYPIKKITLKAKGVSTLSGRKIWFDETLSRLNVDGRGLYLGEFDGDDKILILLKDGSYELRSFDLSTHFDNDLSRIEKYDPEKVYTLVHRDGKSGVFFVKRFLIEPSAIGRRTSLINEEPGSKMILITAASKPVVKIDITKGKAKTPESYEEDLAAFIDVKGMKAQGNRLSPHDIVKVELLSVEEDDDQEDLVDSSSTRPSSQTSVNPSSQNDDDTEVEDIANEEAAEENIVEDSKNTAENSEESPVIPEKKIAPKLDLEITNPDEIEIDNKGQINLF
ncbi:DNA gyrase/topoisomerase IV subunit A [Albibacterium bauzanense]|uniref:Topoisomerase-4 subunit A n=1 Tax=Albibacterium bauzanense TaxID=653929 RepID=A0A4R1LXS0_9SPHI|nr:DNA gyrase/topoisomerase IV subunit A [Albibacterium bauzanense]TCK83360.1 topoisomerase-4 subunit A [Albibacterium bauzanense]